MAYRSFERSGKATISLACSQLGGVLVPSAPALHHPVTAHMRVATMTCPQGQPEQLETCSHWPMRAALSHPEWNQPVLPSRVKKHCKRWVRHASVPPRFISRRHARFREALTTTGIASKGKLSLEIISSQRSPVFHNNQATFAFPLLDLDAASPDSSPLLRLDIGGFEHNLPPALRCEKLAKDITGLSTTQHTGKFVSLLA
jgi:hypothetical protein